MTAKSRGHRYEGSKWGRPVRWLGLIITFVVGPIVYALLVPHYGYLLSLLGALPCLVIGKTLELVVTGPRAYVHEILARRRDRSRLLLYAIGGCVFTSVGIWGFMVTHTLAMALATAFFGLLTLYGLYLWKTAH
jgi:hypothetical protein